MGGGTLSNRIGVLLQVENSSGRLVFTLGGTEEQYMPSHTVTCIQCLTLASVSSLKLLDHAGVRSNTSSGINGARNCYSAFAWQAVVTARHVILYMIT